MELKRRTFQYNHFSWPYLLPDPIFDLQVIFTKYLIDAMS